MPNFRTPYNNPILPKQAQEIALRYDSAAIWEKKFRFRCNTCCVRAFTSSIVVWDLVARSEISRIDFIFSAHSGRSTNDKKVPVSMAHCWQTPLPQTEQMPIAGFSWWIKQFIGFSFGRNAYQRKPDPIQILHLTTAITGLRSGDQPARH